MDGIFRENGTIAVGAVDFPGRINRPERQRERRERERGRTRNPKKWEDVKRRYSIGGLTNKILARQRF